MDTPTMTFEEFVTAFNELEDRGRPGRVLDLLANTLDLSDVAIANKSKISRQTIGDKRNGSSPVRLEDVTKLAKALDIPYDWFLLTPGEALYRLAQQKMSTFACRSPSDVRFCRCGNPVFRASTDSTDDDVTGDIGDMADRLARR